ncbi:MAG: RsmB/NOP family class I SAM-dependent RNA methyltransferase [Rhizobiales bacterium]|nr:RsmB/NOP family class I SAM-dependent RNA methyltransferase [Hyphomicrobiales bacterium]NRB13023.1 RsmB/NOP family class I SAM-dependent RNA methyltransferase [Hyphomicrobiales bacterium]
MRPEAHLAATIEILSTLFETARPTDKYLDGYFKANRYAGSKDKRAIRTIVYDIYRHLRQYEFVIGSAQPRSLVMAYLLGQGDDAETIGQKFNGEKYAAANLSDDEVTAIANAKNLKDASKAVLQNVADWQYAQFNNQFGDNTESELEALNQQASLDVRVNTAQTNIEDAQKALSKQGLESVATSLSPIGLRLEPTTQLTQSPSYRYGAVEIQDEAAQVASLLAGAKPKMSIVDYCAGGGGKTLALAAQMQNKGQVYALDIDQARLKAIKPRIDRAKLHNVQTHKLGSEKTNQLMYELAGNVDITFVDAPCSGTGTWRRAPDARFNLTEDMLNQLVQRQSHILESASKLVKNGGKLVYATCSLFSAENENQVSKFLANNAEFELLPFAQEWEIHLKTPVPQSASSLEGTLLLTPNQHNTDGFFVAVMQRKNLPIS